jgi:hypothetical protein
VPIKSTLILSTAIVLFWFVLLETSFSQVTTTLVALCEGSITLSLSPSHGFVGDTITASVDNLKGEGCIDKRVYIKESSCQGLQYCSCLLNHMEEGVYGCVCTFRAPPTPYISGKEPSRQNTFTYYACVDLDNDGIYDEALGEQGHTNLLIYSRYAPLSLVTESVIIITTLGVLLVIIIFVFRMSFRRR